MKWNITYKEFSLLLGIVVALIIVLTLWLKPASTQTKNLSIKFVPTLPARVPNALTEMVFVTFYKSLR